MLYRPAVREGLLQPTQVPLLYYPLLLPPPTLLVPLKNRLLHYTVLEGAVAAHPGTVAVLPPAAAAAHPAGPAEKLLAPLYRSGGAVDGHPAAAAAAAAGPLPLLFPSPCCSPPLAAPLPLLLPSPCSSPPLAPPLPLLLFPLLFLLKHWKLLIDINTLLFAFT